MGYASVPGSEAAKDGVVITFNAFGTKGNVRGDFNKGRTATHEIAHWMGLKHIWGDDYCGDDGVDDTPQQKSYNFNCPSFPRLSNCSPGSTTGDMFMNFMDLTSDACMNMFTHGQKNKMRAAFALKGLRNSFLRSYQCDASLATGGPLPEDTIPTAQALDVINVFPNPVSNVVKVQSKLAATLQGQTATILTTSGKPLMQQLLNDNNETINIGHLPAGIYMLSVGNSTRKTNFKLIKL
ncbi:MAG: T9SS type A sorting domain-containing protein, partial [Chitinophagaceae bacterium]